MRHDGLFKNQFSIVRRSLAARQRFRPFWEIQPRVAYKLPGCQALGRQHAHCAAFPVSAHCSERSPLGCHRKQSRIRLKHLLPTATVPALAGLAATACLAPQALADPAPAQAPAQSATVADARSYASLAPDELLAAVKPATGHTAGAARAVSYTVRSGDSLSSIAGRFYHKQNAWPV